MGHKAIDKGRGGEGSSSAHRTAACTTTLCSTIVLDQYCTLYHVMEGIKGYPEHVSKVDLDKDQESYTIFSHIGQILAVGSRTLVLMYPLDLTLTLKILDH